VCILIFGCVVEIGELVDTDTCAHVDRRPGRPLRVYQRGAEGVPGAFIWAVSVRLFGKE
jgi:hypothetical protein